ncbi:hypothetical protein [Haliovirga abyssi]|uniref:Outer membrane protein beta-barrel domain-containing protein n=1 Tax=Haliovirga abyssi TaxID=2996794 RepID=A0AAU9D1R6_9FUSO|nr:hypothetical protein [Haliovirga abyssi]BDU49946.1 hypothetical protein HLVA_05150 [Haliovirga abyssi]
MKKNSLIIFIMIIFSLVSFADENKLKLNGYIEYNLLNYTTEDDKIGVGDIGDSDFSFQLNYKFNENLNMNTVLETGNKVSLSIFGKVSDKISANTKLGLYPTGKDEDMNDINFLNIIEDEDTYFNYASKLGKLTFYPYKAPINIGNNLTLSVVEDAPGVKYGISKNGVNLESIIAINNSQKDLTGDESDAYQMKVSGDYTGKKLNVKLSGYYNTREYNADLFDNKNIYSKYAINGDVKYNYNEKINLEVEGLYNYIDLSMLNNKVIDDNKLKEDLKGLALYGKVTIDKLYGTLKYIGKNSVLDDDFSWEKVRASSILTTVGLKTNIEKNMYLNLEYGYDITGHNKYFKDEKGKVTRYDRYTLSSIVGIKF